MNPAVFRKKQFLTHTQCHELNKWVRLAIDSKWMDFGTSPEIGWVNQKRLTTRAYGNRFKYPEIVYQISEKITDTLGLADLPKSIAGGGRDGIVVSFTQTAGDVFEHIDQMEGDSHILRCNIMSQQADMGADLYIGKELVDVEVGELHCYLPSDVPHYVTTVKGQMPRIMWMFGYQCSKKGLRDY